MTAKAEHTLGDLFNDVARISASELYSLDGNITVEKVKSQLKESDLILILGPIAWIYLNMLLVNYTVNPLLYEANINLVLKSVEMLRKREDVVPESVTNMNVV